MIGGSECLWAYVSRLDDKYLFVAGDAETPSSVQFSVINSYVGIRTFTPDVPLDLRTGSTQSASDGLRIYGSDGHHLMLYPSLSVGAYNSLTRGGDRGIFFSDSLSTVSTSAAGLVIAPWASSASGIRITPSGNVGIGTSYTNSKLTVAERDALFSFGGTGISLQYTADTTHYPYIAWSNSSGTRAAYMGWGTVASYLALVLENGNNLYIDSSTAGSVGIIGFGTNPTYPIDVQTYYTVGTTGAYGYVNSSGSGGYYGGATNIGYSINAAGRIKCSEFNLFSDSRIKTHSVTVNIQEALQKIGQLRVVRYRYMDTVSKGNSPKYGLIAQEAEHVLPDVVHKNLDFIPSIYAKATSIRVDSAKGELTVTMHKAHGLKKGDLVRVIGKTSQKETLGEAAVARIISPQVFVLKDWKEQVETLFVYGKQVQDFRVIDYDQVFSVGVGAIQAVSKTVATQEAVLEDHRRSIEALNAELDRLEKTKKRVR